MRLPGVSDWPPNANALTPVGFPPRWYRRGAVTVVQTRNDEYLDALVAVVRRWLEAFLWRTGREETLVDGAPVSRHAIAAREVVELLTADGKVAPDDATLETGWRAVEELAPPDHPFGKLAKALELGDIERRIVTALIAPEREPALERVYAYAANDFTRTRPDVGLLVDLIGGRDPARRDAVRRALAPTSPLRRARIVLVGARGDADTVPPLRRTVRLADRVIGAFPGDDTVDPALARACTVLPAPSDPLVLDTATPEAERLYERLAWQRCGAIPDYALMPDGSLCATTYYWKHVG